MILGPLIHPPLLSALARAGHGAKVLLADGNYPHSTGAPASAERVWLNVAPGLLTVADVLGVLRQAIAIERAAVMVPEPDALPEHRPEVIPSHGWYREALPGVRVDELPRYEFYAAAAAGDVAVLVATGDQALYANLLLTIGTRPA
ncbi:L-fucose mutarotase [Kineosphaera limosa]|uniref:Putative L-fucose mutarotase n=1 Tax=Kineosphaera limosa NBRC 100340 TaxID=1184609 RepID=K6XFF8_9MICO|nr:RbsD/FucU domain-containing protein [Kineosphaera limosa]NYE01181.1 L-fucose mutarotase [Kineosphaera limosa]GAB97584.1 putative L-fucose mutarotase [Kineosphaera limosa NBRC 100340]